MNFADLLSTQGLVTVFAVLVSSVIVICAVGFGIFFITYFAFLFYRYREREKISLDSTLLQITLPRDNEIKIDAAEQMFAGLASIRKSGRFAFLNPQPHISFEIVGQPADIRFYVHTPNKLRDLVEKQINGTYPDAEIT